MTPLKAGIAITTMSQARTLALCFYLNAECSAVELAKKLRSCARSMTSYDPNWSKYLTKIKKELDDNKVIQSVNNIVTKMD